MTNDMPELPSPTPIAARRIPLAIGAVLIGGLIGFAAVYGIGGLKRNAGGDPARRRAGDPEAKLAPLAHEEVAALTIAAHPVRLSDLALGYHHGKAQEATD